MKDRQREGDRGEQTVRGGQWKTDSEIGIVEDRQREGGSMMTNGESGTVEDKQ